jgi:polygalacturonase
MCLNACKNAEVTRCMFFSYRTYSDGIMYSDCEDGYAHDNFVRTGDDAIEVKAFTNTANQTNNILFENNCVWTDKGIAYGCIYESVHDIENVYFKNNSVGFAQASWSNHLGCCVIQMGSMKQATWHDVYFENIEIYKTSCAAISLYNRAANEREGGRIRNIYFKDITVKYMQELNLPVYAINIVIKLADGVDYRNSTIGTLYIDNLTYLGEEITSSNYLDYTNIDLSEEAKFSKSNIKINTLLEAE